MSVVQLSVAENVSHERVEVVGARIEDAFDIHRTLMTALAESGTPYPEPDMPYAIQALMDLIAQQLVAVCKITEGRIVGCIVLDHARWPWVAPNNPAGVHLYNQHFWVDKKYRRGSPAVRLLKFAKDVADAKGLPIVVQLTGLMEIDASVRDRFVRIQGFSYTGGMFYRAPIIASA